MALIDVVKSEAKDGELVYKFPSEDLRVGTQLVVYPAQTAFFVKGGKICDEFTAGTYTIKTENIPILDNLINIPFGKETPFKAEVWFINQTNKLDLKWGTPQPLQLEDPKYNIIVPVRAYGQYGIRISEPRKFLETMIGNMTTFTSEKIDLYLKGKLVAQLSELIATKISRDAVSILDINIHLMEMSSFCENQLNQIFHKYGLELVEFSIMSINVPQDDPSIIRLKEAKDLTARLNITGKDVYQLERSFDVLQTAAGNTGAGGQMVAMGAGLGAGMGVGNTIGQIATNTINTNPVTPPPIPQSTNYYVYVNGQQLGNQSLQQMATMFAQKIIDSNTLVWTAGMSNWLPLSQVPELISIWGQQTPPPIPHKMD